MTGRITILVDAPPGLAHVHVLWPLQRIFEPIVGEHEPWRVSVKHLETRWGTQSIRVSCFSEFPAIVLEEGAGGLSDSPWRGVLDELRLRLLEEQLLIHRDLPLWIFCRHPVAGGGDGIVGLPSGGDLRRLFDGRRRPLVILSGHPEPAEASSDASDLPLLPALHDHRCGPVDEGVTIPPA